MIKYFPSDTFEKKKNNSDGSRLHSVVLLWRFSKQKNKNENTEYHGMFISFEGHLYSKQGSLIFLLFGSWNLVKSSHPEVFCEKGILRNFATPFW